VSLFERILPAILALLLVAALVGLLRHRPNRGAPAVAERYRPRPLLVAVRGAARQRAEFFVAVAAPLTVQKHLRDNLPMFPPGRMGMTRWHPQTPPVSRTVRGDRGRAGIPLPLVPSPLITRSRE
jgi:hypothetical protein